MIRIYIFLFVIGTMGSVVYGAKWYYEDTQEKIATLSANNLVLQNATDTLNDTIDTLEKEAEQQEANNRELQKALQKSEEGLGRLRKRFSEIDITREALADPADLEKRINRGVDRLIKQILEDTTPTNPSDDAERLPVGDADPGDSNSD
jgi:uncharacterized protein YlxW (UPF0749 family)|tara:strand:- start:8949 stop:9395 length:447 start_codon:yes stop_codon:yes gene_type:complete